MNRNRFEGLSKKVLAQCHGDHAELLLYQKREALTRFAGNTVIQNVCSEDLELSLRVFLGKKTGRATGNKIDETSLKALAEKAEEAARAMPERADATLPPASQAYREHDRFSERTWDFEPKQRAEGIAEITQRCREKGFSAAGVFSTGGSAVAVSNSSGLFAFHRQTRCNYSVTVSSEESSGWSEANGWDVEKINFSEVDDGAWNKAVESRNPVAVEPGKYTVVIEPPAVASLILPMSYYSFGALPYHEGRSFLSGRLDSAVLGSRITIDDDAFHSLSEGLPFDYEGMPREQVKLIDQGVAKGVVYDCPTAAKWQTRSTGHSLPQPNSIGPIPSNLVLAPGTSSLPEMIQSTEKGILVTQLHYVNVIDPVTLLLTGMTRNGTFLIEKGKITGPIKNLRFTQSVVKALKNVEEISRDAVLSSGFFGGTVVVPAMRIREFNFTSATAF